MNSEGGMRHWFLILYKHLINGGRHLSSSDLSFLNYKLISWNVNQEVDETFDMYKHNIIIISEGGNKLLWGI